MKLPRKVYLIDIVDCILAANSSNSRVVISFDNDMKKLKAFNETL